MKSHQNKIIGEGLTYDDVLLVPNFSKILPREVSIKTKFSKNISINIPIISAAILLSVTVSMAAEIIGILIEMFFENLVLIDTSLGRILEKFGTSRTSSYVRPSPIILLWCDFIAIRL